MHTDYKNPDTSDHEDYGQENGGSTESRPDDVFNRIRIILDGCFSALHPKKLDGRIERFHF